MTRFPLHIRKAAALLRFLPAALAPFAPVIAAAQAAPQPVIAVRSAIVALVDDPGLRMSFEDQMVTTARAHRYDAVASHSIVPDVADLDARMLEADGIGAVLMLRPAAVGEGSSLETVRGEVDPEVYEHMRSFAREVSDSGTDDLIAVIHLAIYTLSDGEARLLSSGAVWLDEPVENQEQGIERLQDLIITNIDAARPAMRQRLGLPPL